MEKFIPVKITDKKWADKLLDGEIFMRPLYEFGIWNASKNAELDNNFRGDITEGAVQVVSDTKNCDYVKGFPEKFQEYIKHINFIDEGELKFFKIFCLYCLKLDKEKNKFIKPDENMGEFGDTAVIIRDIAVAVPVENFLNLSFSDKYRYRFAMADDGQEPTSFDRAVEATRKMMSNYQSNAVIPQMIIY